MKTFFISTLGCKVNQFESETIAQSLEQSGNRQIQGSVGADICIINTCTVTRKAAMQSRQAVRQAIRNNPDARIIVTGCHAQTDPDDIRRIKGVHAVVGQVHKTHIGNLIPEVLKSDPSFPIRVNGDFSEDAALDSIREIPVGSRARPYLKIQDGCSAFCSYCIVPYARGPSRSLSPERVIDLLFRLQSAGGHEAVLTGIHLGIYGMELNPPTNIVGLLRHIDAAACIGRIRLSSIEPREFDDELIRFAASGWSSVELCRHFHIPMQSGDDAILERMNRPYDRSFFRNRVMCIHDAMPDASVGVDVLVGFPGETDAAFERTYSLLEEIPVSYCHVFPFSPRSGTPAETFTGKVPFNIVKERCLKLRKLGQEKRKRFYERAVGRNMDAVMEGRIAGTTDLFKGITSNYISVLVQSKSDLTRSLVPVTIVGLDKNNETIRAIGRINKGESHG